MASIQSDLQVACQTPYVLLALAHSTYTEFYFADKARFIQTPFCYHFLLLNIKDARNAIPEFTAGKAGGENIAGTWINENKLQFCASFF